MKRSIRCLLAILSLIMISSAKSSGQYKTLAESPMFKNNKVNVFRDTANGTVYSMHLMDSLYQAGAAKFQIFNFKTRADSVYWQIRFITELPTIKPKWAGKNFPFNDFTDLKGNRITPGKLKGKIIIINCWSVTCGPCVKEIPYLNKLKDSLGEKNFVFLALTYDQPEEIEKFLASDKLKKFLNIAHPEFNFHLIADQKDYLDKQLALISYPTTFIVDQKGIVSEVLEGVNLDSRQNPKSFEEIMAAVKRIQ